MRKVLSFSLFLMLGLVASQLLPGALGTAYPGFKATADTLLYICLGFIMINVGREFEIDKSRWRSYTADYFIAMLRRKRKKVCRNREKINNKETAIRNYFVPLPRRLGS